MLALLSMVASGVWNRRERRERRVLVVDDDASTLASAKRSLRLQCRVATADTIERGIAAARHLQPDVAIIDLRISHHSGLELLRVMKTDLPETICVLYSGFLSIPCAVEATRAGADLVLSKPIPFGEILRRVDGELAEPPHDDTPTLARVEWDHIARVLDDCHGNISEAARRLGIYRSSLQRRLRKQAPPR